jgi:hypothetical protein
MCLGSAVSFVLPVAACCCCGCVCVCSHGWGMLPSMSRPSLFPQACNDQIAPAFPLSLSSEYGVISPSPSHVALLHPPPSPSSLLCVGQRRALFVPVFASPVPALDKAAVLGPLVTVDRSRHIEVCLRHVPTGRPLVIRCVRWRNWWDWKGVGCTPCDCCRWQCSLPLLVRAPCLHARVFARVCICPVSMPNTHQSPAQTITPPPPRPPALRAQRCPLHSASFWTHARPSVPTPGFRGRGSYAACCRRCRRCC